MGFNLGTSNNNGKLHMSDFLSSTPDTIEKDIPIEQLVPWENQPFKMYSEFKLNELAESIKENGLLSRIIVYPISDGRYRIIAGHNRVEACKLAGMTNIPSIVKNGIDDNRAKLIMADTNLCQRTELLPSERAYAYKAQQEALIALGSPRATADISDKYGESRRTIQRYISCSRLTPKLMDQLDEGKITLNTAVILSGLPASSQKEAAAYLKDNPNKSIDPKTAKVISEKRFVTKADIQAVIENPNGTASRKQDGKMTKPSIAKSDPSEEAIPSQLPQALQEHPEELEEISKGQIQNEGKTISEKKNISKEAITSDIRLGYEEVAEIIGDSLSFDEVEEFLFYCLQRQDFIDEWQELYNNEEDESL